MTSLTASPKSTPDEEKTVKTGECGDMQAQAIAADEVSVRLVSGEETEKGKGQLGSFVYCRLWPRKARGILTEI